MMSRSTVTGVFEIAVLVESHASSLDFAGPRYNRLEPWNHVTRRICPAGTSRSSSRATAAAKGTTPTTDSATLETVVNIPPRFQAKPLRGDALLVGVNVHQFRASRTFPSYATRARGPICRKLRAAPGWEAGLADRFGGKAGAIS